MEIGSLRRALGDRATENEPLARHTTLRIGGPADLWVRATSLTELIEYLRLARDYGLQALILGNGSNVLVLDGGIRGLAVENRSDRWQLERLNEETAVLHVSSGASLPLLANRLAREGWSGLEWGIGIPGTFGGAIIGNAGAHGKSMADCVRGVRALDPNGSEVTMPVTDLGMEYRRSRFKHSREWVLLEADIMLSRAEPNECIARMNGYTVHRRRTQPTEASVGSMFKNPPGDYAGRLIEQAGLKGAHIGGAEISPVHANFIVNHGMASANDVLELVEMARTRVQDRFGVSLELEIQVVGDPEVD